MALFGNLFEKKYCAVCGSEIKLLGNRKLSDGNLCKNCASKLSPWFSERRQSTVDEIKEQLEYRENNKKEVDAFNVTRTLGKSTKVLLDEDQKKFIVTSESNWRASNPDVLSYSLVTGCNIDVDESRTEIRKRLEEGKTESYKPAQYNYRYNINVTIFVNHPYFQEMKFQVNSGSILIKNPYVDERGVVGQPNVHGAIRGAGAATQHRPGLNQQRPGMQPQRPGMGGGLFGGIPTFQPDPHDSVEFCEIENIAYEIKEALTNARETYREEVLEANQPKQAVTCPYCGATTLPDANGCCEYCGAAIGK